MVFEEKQGRFLVTTDKRKVSVKEVHSYLTRSYWAKNISIEIVRRSIKNSLCFSLLEDKKQIGFARLITDCSTFAYLADVYILEAYRGRKLSLFLMSCIKKHPDLQALRRWLLATRDAHHLYEKFGFKALEKPTRFMELHQPNVYN